MKEWRKDRLRRALEYVSTYSVEYYDQTVTTNKYKLLSESIEDTTGVSIPWKRLQAFIKGVKTHGIRHWPSLTPKRLEAVIDFFKESDDPNSPISDIDLELFDPDLQAPLFLHEYVRSKTHEVASISSNHLKETFVCLQSTERRYNRYLITFESLHDDGTFTVVFTEERYFTSSSQKATNTLVINPVLEKGLKPDIQNIYQGWGIITPENGIAIYCKHLATGENLRLQLIAHNEDFHENDILTNMIFSRTIYPMELDNPDETSALYNMTTSPILNFTAESLIFANKAKNVVN